MPKLASKFGVIFLGHDRWAGLLGIAGYDSAVFLPLNLILPILSSFPG